MKKGRKDRMKIDYEKTKRYYKELKVEDLCDCDYCKNFRLHIRSSYPELALYFERLGVDIEKPLENTPGEPDKDGNMPYYVCQYVVFGTCPKDYHHQIGTVTIDLGMSYPSTGIEEEHFVLDACTIELKWSF